MKRIVLLTSTDLDGYSTDEHLLVDELEGMGFSVALKPWETFVDEGEDLFIIRTTWNYTDHFEKFISCLEQIKDRLWNPLDLVKWNSDKRYLVDLHKKGVEVMPLVLADSNQTVLKALDQLGGDEFIIKPLISASAKGLVKFDRTSVPSIDKEMIVQKFYPEISKGEVSLMFFKNQFAYAIKKTPKQGEIRVQEEYGGTVSAYTPSDHEMKLSQSVLKHIPTDWFYVRVDIVPGVGLIELECIEPALYFSSYEDAAQKFAKVIQSHMV